MAKAVRRPMKTNVKRITLSIVTASLIACGGGSTKKPPDTGLSEEASDDDEGRHEEETEVPAPLEWSARAELAPVKGVKMKAATITFHQIDGEDTTVWSEAPLTGLAPGTYRFVVHEGSDCGKNAARIGGAFEPAAGVELTVAVSRREPGAVDADVGYTLDGRDSIAGHTLVLHADKKGVPGKVVACGAIVADARSADDPDDD